MKNLSLWCASALLMTLYGCDSNDNSADNSDSVLARTSASSSVNVFDDYIAAAQKAPTSFADNSVNFLDHPGFENGLGGWNGCNEGAVSVSTESQSGDGAMQLNAGNCAYQTVSAIPDQTFSVSCYVKLTDDTAWTGMGMTASNGSFKSVAEAPTVTVTSGDYAKVQTSFTLPSNATFLSVWLHSDHGAIVDNCSLTLADSVEPEATFDEPDLLINGGFASVNANGRAKNWATGCNGQVAADGQSLRVLNGACVDQNLSSDRIAALADKSSTLSCMIEDVTGYADMGVYLDDKAVSARRIKAKHKGERLSLKVPAAAGQNGFISFYADGTLELKDCTYLVEGGEIGDVDPGNEIEFVPTDEPVVFASSELEALVRIRLRLDADHTITAADMSGLEELYDNRGEGAKVESLVGLEHATNLNSMVLTTFKVTDLSPLAGLTELTFLRLDSQNIVNIDALANLTELTYLYLRPSELFTDISVTASLTNLKTLIVHGDSSIADLSPLSGLNELATLHIYGGTVADMTPVASLPMLESMFTGGTVENIPALAAGTGLGDGDVFSLQAADNDLSANSANLVALHALNDRGVSLYISGTNGRVDLPEIGVGL